MDDPVWCRAQLDHLDDDLRRLGHSFERFAVSLEETKLLWNDAASQSAFARFLDPYRAQLATTLQRLAGQMVHLHDVVNRMSEAQKPAEEIFAFSEEAVGLHEVAETAVLTARHRIDHAINEASDSSELSVRARQILASI